MESGKYVDEQKKKLLYEQQNPESLARDILDEWETNQRVNEKIARRVLSGQKMETTYCGVFAEKMKGVGNGIITMFGGMDGWRINKAIEAEGQRASKEAEEKQSFIEKLGV